MPDPPPLARRPVADKPRKEMERVNFDPDFLPKRFLLGERCEVTITNRRKFEIFFEVELPPGSAADIKQGYIQPGSSLKVTFRVISPSLLPPGEMPTVLCYFQPTKSFPSFWRKLNLERDYDDESLKDGSDHIHDYEEMAEILNKIIAPDKEYLRGLQVENPLLFSKLGHTLRWTMDDTGLGSRRAFATMFFRRNTAEQEKYRQNCADLRAKGAEIAHKFCSDEELKKALKKQEPDAYKKFHKFVKRGNRKAPVESAPESSSQF